MTCSLNQIQMDSTSQSWGGADCKRGAPSKSSSASVLLQTFPDGQGRRDSQSIQNGPLKEKSSSRLDRALEESVSSTFLSVHRSWRTKTAQISPTKRKDCEENVSPATNILFLRINTDQSWGCTENVFCLVISNNFWLQTSEGERSKCDVCGRAAVRTSWVGMEEGAKECACQVDLEGGARDGLTGPRWRPRPWLDVELRDRPLSARVCVLAVDALAVAFHLGQVLVEDLPRPQGRYQVVELAAVVLAVCLGFAGLAFSFPLLFELRDRGRTEMELKQSFFCYLPHKLKTKTKQTKKLLENIQLRRALLWGWR